MVDFTGVPEASDKAMTSPGTIDVFKITGVEFAETQNTGKPFMKVVFENKDSSFSHNFFMTQPALPRIQALARAVTGQPFTGNQVTEEQIASALKGKEVALKVLGRVNEETGKGYPDLGFGGFGKSVAQKDELIFSATEQRIVNDTLEAIAQSRMGNADSEQAPAPSGSTIGSSSQPTGVNDGF